MVGADGNESRVPRWKSWTRLWAWVVAAVLLVLLVAAAFVDTLAVVLLAAPGVLAVAFGSVELLAPRKFLAYRDADTPRSGGQRRTLEAFDDALEVSRTKDGEFTDVAVRRVRVTGAGVLAFGVLAVVAAIAAHRGG